MNQYTLHILFQKKTIVYFPFKRKKIQKINVKPNKHETITFFSFSSLKSRKLQYL